jgi:hypothetical protein
MGATLEEIGGKLVPETRPALLAFINFAIRHDGGELAWQMWERWERAPAVPGFQISQTFGYLNFLLKRGQLDRARRVWQLSGEDVVFNGGFEEQALNGGMDWVLPNHPEVYYEYDHLTRFEGAASLRIDFAGKSNLNYSGLRQNLILPAGRHELSFVVRSENITSDQGLYFELRSSEMLAKSEEISGTQAWRRLTQEFEVDRPTAASLVLRRRPSEKFDNILGGRVWIDKVEIKKQSHGFHGLNP